MNKFLYQNHSPLRRRREDEGYDLEKTIVEESPSKSESDVDDFSRNYKSRKIENESSPRGRYHRNHVSESPEIMEESPCESYPVVNELSPDNYTAKWVNNKYSRLYYSGESSSPWPFSPARLGIVSGSQDITVEESPSKSEVELMSYKRNGLQTQIEAVLSPLRRRPGFDSQNITVDDSPSKSQTELLITGLTPLGSQNVKLAAQMRRTIAQDTFALRNWSNSVKKSTSRIDDTGSIQLFVAKCFKLSGNHEKGGHFVLLTLCTDLPKSDGFLVPDISQEELKFHWVIFRTKTHGQFLPGSSLIKLHPPWLRIPIPTLNEDVTIRTDFYQFIRPSEIDVNYEVLLTQVQLAKSKIDEKVSDFFKSGATSQGSFLNLVPYKIKNMKTIKKQVVFNRRSIDLEVVICHFWFYEKSIGILVKDSDNILSFIEASSNDENLMENLAKGKLFRFQSLMLRKKVTPELSLPLFSVIATFGSLQTESDRFYYKLLLTRESVWEVVHHLEIDFDRFDCPKKSIQELFEIPENLDSRFTVEGLLKRNMALNKLFLHDCQDFNIKIKINVMPGFGMDRILALNSNEIVQLNFLRLFRGISAVKLENLHKASLTKCKYRNV